MDVTAENRRMVKAMTDVQMDAFLSWAKRNRTEIAINEAIIRTIEEILSLHEDGLLSDLEYIEVCRRIGW